jgi:hypothetical protein
MSRSQLAQTPGQVTGYDVMQFYSFYKWSSILLVSGGQRVVSGYSQTKLQKPFEPYTLSIVAIVNPKLGGIVVP